MLPAQRCYRHIPTLDRYKDESLINLNEDRLAVHKNEAGLRPRRARDGRGGSAAGRYRDIAASTRPNYIDLGR